MDLPGNWYFEFRLLEFIRLSSPTSRRTSRSKFQTCPRDYKPSIFKLFGTRPEGWKILGFARTMKFLSRYKILSPWITQLRGSRFAKKDFRFSMRSFANRSGSWNLKIRSWKCSQARVIEQWLKCYTLPQNLSNFSIKFTNWNESIYLRFLRCAKTIKAHAMARAACPSKSGASTDNQMINASIL